MIILDPISDRVERTTVFSNTLLREECASEAIAGGIVSPLGNWSRVLGLTMGCGFADAATTMSRLCLNCVNLST